MGNIECSLNEGEIVEWDEKVKGGTHSRAHINL